MGFCAAAALLQSATASAPFELRAASAKPYARPIRAVSDGGFQIVPAGASLSYSTYFGGSSSDIVTGAAVDPAGNLYLTGYTNSTDLPGIDSATTRAASGSCGSGEDAYACFDAFVAKMDPAGRSLLYIAYLGGSGDDFATSIAVDGLGNATIAGYTNSADLPTRNAFQPEAQAGSCTSAEQLCFDAFVAKLSPGGTEWTYASYLGGGGDDIARGIAVDAAGNAVVTGTTNSPDFPTLRGFQSEWQGGESKGFVAKLEASGQLVFSSFLGGSGDDFATSIALDISGAIYLAGYTNSTNLPATSGTQPGYAGGTCGKLESTFPCFDALIAKIAPDGASLDYLTYLGGTGGDYARAIAVDSFGRATVVGMTTSQDFPVTFGAFQAEGGSNTDAFVTRLSPAGDALVFSTYLGGIGPDSAVGVSVDSDGRTVVAGTTWGSDFPLVNPVQAGPGGFYDEFLAVLNEDGSALEFSTRLGGAGHEQARSVALDRFANVYVTADTFSTDYPAVRALQPLYGGGSFDGVVTRISMGTSPVFYSSTSQLTFGLQLVGTRSEAQSVSLSNIGGGELRIESVTTIGDFEVQGDCPSLGPGESCDLAIVFLPTAPGSQTGSVTIGLDGAGAAAQLELSGTCIAPEIRLSAGNIAFDSQLVGTESGPQEITLTNVGSAPLELSEIKITGDFAQSNDCSSIIPESASCSIRVVFSPTTTGMHEGALSVSNHQPEETKQALLTGMGGDFSLSSSSNEISITAGESVSFTISAIPAGGLKEELVLTCTGAPRAAACTLSQSQVSLDGETPSVVTATITTTSRGVAALHWRDRQWPLLLTAILLLLLLPAIFMNCAPKVRVPARHSLAFASLMAVAFLVTACGGGGGASQPSRTSTGTPAGTYVLTITATCGRVSRSSSISLVVR